MDSIRFSDLLNASRGRIVSAGQPGGANVFMYTDDQGDLFLSPDEGALLGRGHDFHGPLESIESVIKGLKSSMPSIALKTVYMLCHRAPNSYTYKSELVEKGVVPALLLCESRLEPQTERKAWRQMGLEGVARCQCCGKQSGRSMIASILWSLACGHPPNKLRIVEQGALDLLLRLLQPPLRPGPGHGPGVCAKYACLGVWSVCYSVPANQALAVEKGAVPLLMPLLAHSASSIRYAAAGAIWHISAHPQYKSSLIFTTDLLTSLIAVLEGKPVVFAHRHPAGSKEGGEEAQPATAGDARSGSRPLLPLPGGAQGEAAAAAAGGSSALQTQSPGASQAQPSPQPKTSTLPQTGAQVQPQTPAHGQTPTPARAQFPNPIPSETTGQTRSQPQAQASSQNAAADQSRAQTLTMPAASSHSQPEGHAGDGAQAQSPPSAGGAAVEDDASGALLALAGLVEANPHSSQKDGAVEEGGEEEEEEEEDRSELPALTDDEEDCEPNCRSRENACSSGSHSSGSTADGGSSQAHQARGGSGGRKPAGGLPNELA
eukprot:jgi/Mesen1/619/ME000108S10776